MIAARRAEVLTVGELLTGARLFYIPPYQREFCWGKEQLDRLLDGLFETADSLRGDDERSQGLFLSAISLIEPNDPRRPTRRTNGALAAASEVVDGQQRLVTLSIVAACLRDLMGESAHWLDGFLEETSTKRPWPRGTPRLVLHPDEADFFIDWIASPGATLKRISAQAPTPSLQHMKLVRDRAMKSLMKLDRPQLGRLARVLRDRCELAVIVSHDLDSGYRTYVAINDRGKPLKLDEVLKAELIGDVPAERRGACLARWNKLKSAMDHAPLDADPQERLAASLENLFSHIHMLRGRNGSTIIHSITLLAKQAGGSEDFIGDIVEPMAERFLAVKHAFHSGHEHSEAIRGTLVMLNWLKSNDWVPVAMDLLDRFESEPGLALEGLQALNRLALFFGLTGIGTQRRLQRYRLVLDSLRAGAYPSFEMAGFALSPDEHDSFMHMAVNNAYKGKEHICKVLLAILEHDLSGTGPLRDLNDGSTEHILPRTPGNKDGWWQAIPDQRVRDIATRSLGNLTLVSRTQNKLAMNHDYATKRTIYFAKGADADFALLNQLKPVKAWTAVAILARERELAGRLRELWQLKATDVSKLARAIERSRPQPGEDRLAS